MLASFLQTLSGSGARTAESPLEVVPLLLRTARDLVTAVFRRAGAEVFAASSVRDGLEQFHANLPDVVLCDLAMPDEDGFVFIRSVRALTRPAGSVPVIALTAFGRPEDRQRTLDAGFTAYMKKPVDPLELATVSARLARAAR